MQEYLEEHEEVTFDIFLEKIWDNIHEIYRRPQEETKETETDSAASETPDVSLCYVIGLHVAYNKNAKIIKWDADM